MDTGMTIGAFARRTGLSITALRFYDRRGVLTPAWVDPATGCRRYADHQVERAELIRDLRQLDLPLTTVGEALEASPEHRRHLVAEHLERLEASTARVRDRAHSMRLIDHEDQTMLEAPTIELRDLRRAVDRVTPAAGRDPHAPHLMTVLLATEGEALRIVATDRHRLAVCDVATSTDGDHIEVVLPAAALPEWLTELPAEGLVVLRTAGDELVAVVDDDQRSVPVLPITFPDHRPLLEPPAVRSDTAVGRQDLLRILDSVDGGAITLSADHGALVVGTDDGERRLVSTGSGPEEPVVLDRDYVWDAVAASSGPDVVIGTTSPTAPVWFRSVGDDASLALVMPIAT